MIDEETLRQFAIDLTEQVRSGDVQVLPVTKEWCPEIAVLCAISMVLENFESPDSYKNNPVWKAYQQWLQTRDIASNYRM